MQIIPFWKDDELVKVSVKIPTALSTEEKDLIEEFARIRGEAVNSKESFVDKIKRTFK